MSEPTPSGDLTIAVVAKECVPGRVKTRLHPPLSLAEAAAVARACLADTLATLAGLPAARRVLFLDGSADDPLTLPPEAAGWEVLPQPAGTLDVRLGHLFDVVDGPILLVGMDTPQLTGRDLAPALAPAFGVAEGPAAASTRVLSATGHDDGAPDVWLGPAQDGGYWALAFTARAARTLASNGPRAVDDALAVDDSGRVRRGDLVRGVPMSRDDTGRLQRERLVAHGLRVGTLATLVDVDTVADLLDVVPLARPGGELARLARAMAPLVAGASRAEASRGVAR